MSRTYVIQTLGCQMNVHDSERIAGSLDAAGYLPARPGQDPDLIVFNTCAVRENADNKLYGHLSFLAPTKKANPDLANEIEKKIRESFVPVAVDPALI
ncbi:MAG: hypothetical protein EBZ99_02715, partial [Actinobacteria bacterium]|nr:hypothetical protein [Actinomycetota bacterium]